MGVALLALGAGCPGGGSSPVVEETHGELGQGTFRWRCVSESDPTCGTGVFPHTVALGSSFDLEFFPDYDLPDEISYYEVDSASRQRVEPIGEGFFTHTEGEISMLAKGEGYGVDFVNLTVRPVEYLVVQRTAEEEDLEGIETDTDEACFPWECDADQDDGRRPSVFAVVGQDTEFEAFAYYDERRLAGALDYEWESLTPETLRIDRDSANEVVVEGVSVGRARLRVTAGGVMKTIEFSVYEPYEPPDPPPPDPGTTGSDTDGSDTDGSDTGGSDTGGSDTGTGGETEGGSTTGGGR